MIATCAMGLATPRVALADPDGFTSVQISGGGVGPLQGGPIYTYYQQLFSIGIGLVDAAGNGIPNEPLVLHVGSIKITCITDMFGAVNAPACEFRNKLALGHYVFTATFAGDPNGNGGLGWQPSSDWGRYTVSKGFAELDMVNGPTVFHTRTTVSWYLNLHESYGDVGPPIPGQRLVGTISSTDFPQTQTCVTRPTDRNGNAVCTIHVTQPPNNDESLDFHFRGSSLYFYTSPGNDEPSAMGQVLP